MKLKNMPQLQLTQLLRRRKMTLARMITEFGISTYGALLEHCARMGVLAPPQKEFDTVVCPSTYVNDPCEGVVSVDLGQQDEPRNALTKLKKRSTKQNDE